MKKNSNYSGVGTASRLPPPPAGGARGGHLSYQSSSNTFPPLNPPMLAVGETSNVHLDQQTWAVTKNKIVALQIDPLVTLKPESDTSIALGLEAQKLGYRIFCYQPENLSLLQGSVYAHGSYVELHNDNKNFYTILSNAKLELAEAEFVLMRQDPPFNMSYITATYLLEMLDGINGCRVLNNPREVRNNPEKLIPFQFPQFMPRTVITKSFDEIHDFWKEMSDIVIKPLYLYGGKGVFRFKDSANMAALVEFYNLSLNEPLIAQEFIPEVTTAEKRVIMIDGEIAGAMQRAPMEGEIRSNTRIGGTPLPTDLTLREIEVCQAVGKFLKEKGLFLAGLDLIGGFLNEVNITSPTGILAINKLYGLSLQKLFWQKLV